MSQPYIVAFVQAKARWHQIWPRDWERSSALFLLILWNDGTNFAQKCKDQIIRIQSIELVATILWVSMFRNIPTADGSNDKWHQKLCFGFKTKGQKVCLSRKDSIISSQLPWNEVCIPSESATETNVGPCEGNDGWHCTEARYVFFLTRAPSGRCINIVSTFWWRTMSTKLSLLLRRALLCCWSNWLSSASGSRSVPLPTTKQQWTLWKRYVPILMVSYKMKVNLTS